jgi:hypothetical protein
MLAIFHVKSVFQSFRIADDILNEIFDEHLVLIFCVQKAIILCKLSKDLVIQDFDNQDWFSVTLDELLIDSHDDFIYVCLVIFVERYLGIHSC